MFSPGRKKPKNKGGPITLTAAAATAATATAATATAATAKAATATPKTAPAYKYTNLWRKLEKYCQGRGAKTNKWTSRRVKAS